MLSSNLLALAASFSSALAAYQGFNYGATNSDGTFKFQADYQKEFAAAKSLAGDFASARLYTMIQGGSSTNEPIQAIPAAIAEKTSLLLTLWASGGQGQLSAEITALKSAIEQWGSEFTELVAGISVGSEDLYRISPTGIAAKSGYGAEPQTLADYIGQVREAIKGTPLSGASIGHVDTWTAWVNGSNQAVIDACDWIGMDAYPYFQSTQSNGIENGKSLFEAALSDTKNAVGGKPVWITETGWPVSGSTQNLAEPNTDNAKTYWDEVGCPLFGDVNTWWFTLIDETPTAPNPSFGVVGSDFKPHFDLSCSAPSSSSSSSAAASASSKPAGSGSGSLPSESAASSGGDASPTQGNAGSPNSSASSGGSSSSPTGAGGSSGGNLSTTAAPSIATATTVVSGPGGSTTGSGSPAGSSGPAIVDANAATALSGSFVGAIIAVGAAIIAL